MSRSRPAIALATILAVLGTALWPLVASLREASTGEALPLCHQAGLQVDAASAPLPAEPGDPTPGRKTHCPLCVMVFIAAFGAAPAAPTFFALDMGDSLALEPAALHRRFAVALPQGRAPPPLAV